MKNLKKATMSKTISEALDQSKKSFLKVGIRI